MPVGVVDPDHHHQRINEELDPYPDRQLRRAQVVEPLILDPGGNHEQGLEDGLCLTDPHVLPVLDVAFPLLIH